MRNTSYATAKWGFSWDETTGPSAQQGTANLTDRGVTLDVPFGELLEEKGQVTIGNGHPLPYNASYLYGWSQDGFYLALKDAGTLLAVRTAMGEATRQSEELGSLPADNASTQKRLSQKRNSASLACANGSAKYQSAITARRVPNMSEASISASKPWNK